MTAGPKPEEAVRNFDGYCTIMEPNTTKIGQLFSDVAKDDENSSSVN